MLLSAAISVGPVAFTPPAAAEPLNAGVYLTPDSGPAGTDVTVGGQGFEACGAVTITFDGGHAEPGTVNVPEISGSITVPEGTPAGQHSIEATCDEDPDTGDYYYGSASFTVTGDGTPPSSETPALQLDRSEGPPGTTIGVEGSGFGTCYAEDVELYVDERRALDYRIDVGAETGTFSEQITLADDIEPGDHRIRAVCVGYPGVSAEAPFVVTGTTTEANPVLTVAPEQDVAGATATVTGTGFTCTEAQLLWDGSEQLATATVDGSGDLGAAITVPDDAAEGAHTIRAVCVDYPEQYADAPFTVTPTGGGTDNGGTDNGGTDNGGTDNGGTDNGGTDNGGTDTGGTDTGGTDTGGGSGGSGGGSSTPVGVVVGGTSGAALALAAAALVYFGRLHRGPRWVHKHIRATLRPATGATALTETRQPGDPPTHTTRLDPHADPGRQRLEGDGSEEEER
ncbi:hypothetical protein [Streptomyces sp. NPDC127114]|uniref:hypothetical protein n=1 Tax=Streptomyces sp. NPDC127114 TaxID=3345366 RepID=UPI0036313EA3